MDFEAVESFETISANGFVTWTAASGHPDITFRICFLGRPELLVEVTMKNWLDLLASLNRTTAEDDCPGVGRRE